jgi:hypothetical protein
MSVKSTCRLSSFVLIYEVLYLASGFETVNLTCSCKLYSFYKVKCSMKDHINKIIDSGYEIANRWSDFAVLWRLSSLPVETEFSRLYDETFEKYYCINMQMIEGFYNPEVVQSLQNPEFLPKLAEVNNYLSTALSCINKLLSEFNLYQDAEFREVGSNLESIKGFVNGDHVITINIGAHLDIFNESLFKAHHVGIWWCVVL